MATGADHYAKAERLLEPVQMASYPGYAEPNESDIALAQVHATLALAAAVEKQTRLTTGEDAGGYT